MRHATQTLSLAAVFLVFLLIGPGAGAAPPEEPLSQVPREAPSLRLDGPSQAALGAETEGSLCLGDTGGQPAPALEPSPVAGQNLASPCCQTLCDQVCGVNQACACRRCVVFGCEL